MGKTRDLFKKVRDTKGVFHAKMGSIKDRNAMDLTEAEDIKKRWQEQTELYKKIFTAQIIMTLRSLTLTQSQTSQNVKSSGPQKGSLQTKLVEVMGFQWSYFKSSNDAVKVLHSICQQIWKTQQWPKTGKGQFSFQSQRKAMPKNVQTSTQLHSSHKLAK